MQAQHEIGNFFAKNTNGKIKVKIIHDTFNLIRFFLVKEGQAPLYRSNKVYHNYCSCSSNYIGETVRYLLTRLNVKNADVTNHLLESSDHKVDFAKLKILEQPEAELSTSFLKLLTLTN